MPVDDAYRWWTVKAGDSAVYGKYLKLGPVTFLLWESRAYRFFEICWMCRLVKWWKWDI